MARNSALLAVFNGSRREERLLGVALGYRPVGIVSNVTYKRGGKIAAKKLKAVRLETLTPATVTFKITDKPDSADDEDGNRENLYYRITLIILLLAMPLQALGPPPQRP